MATLMMPHLFSFAGHNSDDVLQETEPDQPQKKSLRRPSLLKNIGSLLKRHHEAEPLPQTAPPEEVQLPEYFAARRRSFQDTTTRSRRAIPSLPRPQTFRRQESERREKLLEVEPSPTEKRALSVERRRCLSATAARRTLSPPPISVPSLSAPAVNSQQYPPLTLDQQTAASITRSALGDAHNLPSVQRIEEINGDPECYHDDLEDRDIDRASLQGDCDRRWILNLSMQFKDKSHREKFFVTYAESPSKWRRLTVSLDYRDAPEDSLEADLTTLRYQKDKSLRIYESVRESLPDIQYYDTVTNLKLETTPDDGQLHVHVREDANEIIHYPSASMFSHVHTRTYAESEIDFISHLSGFVYKVRAGGRVMIKKEIPGADTVDEFLYEVNALDTLLGCDSVIHLEGLVTDETGDVVKGLLISYASQGALVDMLYDFRGTRELPWHRREKWARQIVQGLSGIHEAGFVQGDFTLSNLVIDEDDNAQIIDINRRGCPVGWEPPELGRLIDSGQRIGMHIGVKTDLYQLGMVLWALAEEVDDPERIERPLPSVMPSIPSYFRDLVTTCLSERPQDRIPANKLLRMFPASAGTPSNSRRLSVGFDEHVRLHDDNDTSTHRSAREYIDPDLAVTLDEVRGRRGNDITDLTSAVTYIGPDENVASTSYHFESSGSWIVGNRRGRSPVSSRRRRSSPFARPPSSATSLSTRSPARDLQPSSTQCSNPRFDEQAGEGIFTNEDPPSIAAPDQVLSLQAQEVQGCEQSTPDSVACVFELPPDGHDMEVCTTSIHAGQTTTTDTGYPSTAPADLVPVEKLQEYDQTTPRALPNTKLETLQHEDFTQLLHSDSGFDEHMTNETQLDGGITTTGEVLHD